MDEVVLHIGAFKSGTTFVQACLGKNQDRLATRGVLSPAWTDQARGLNQLIARPKDPAGSRPADAWDRLVEQCLAWDGSRAVISMEYLSLLGGVKTDMAVAPFGDVPVRVVLTIRHLAGALPAQWQTSLRGGGHTWTLDEYVRSATSPTPRKRPAGRHFWRRHNWPAITGRWGKRVGTDRVRVVTVPAPGSPDALLWERFCQAASIDPRGLPATSRRKESLGAISAELVRRVNVQLAASPAPSAVVRQQRRWTKATLAARTLLPRKPLEPSIVVPGAVDAWARQRGSSMLQEMADRGSEIIGSESDLTYSVASGTAVVPVSDEDVLAAGEYALDRLAAAGAVVGVDSVRSVDDAVEELARLARVSAASAA
jgi:hypothetical protein